jgi:hypothetical protein
MVDITIFLYYNQSGVIPGRNYARRFKSFGREEMEFLWI